MQNKAVYLWVLNKSINEMKMKTIITFLLALSSFATHAQMLNGTVKYKTTFKINWHSICQGDPSCIARMENMPNSSISFWNLDFNKQESLYTKIDSIADVESVNKLLELGMGPGDFDPNQTVYIDNINKSVHMFNPYFNFYVTDTLKASDIKIGSEYKDILGYKCLKATIGYSCILWFSPEIPLPYGPGEHNGLPGMILEISCNAQGVNTVITAYDIKLNNFKEINKPKGKYISKVEYDKIVEEMQK